MMDSHPQHFVVLEIMNIHPSYFDYPIQANHYMKIDLVHYGKPRIYQWNKSLFTAHHIDISTEDRLKRWRAYALGTTPKKFQTCYLIGEQKNLKIYSVVCARYYKSPMLGTIITNHI